MTARYAKRIEARQLERELAAPDDGWQPEMEAVLGECRHGCNGDCIVLGFGSDVCDFLCHPGLECDEEKTARIAEILEDSR